MFLCKDIHDVILSYIDNITDILSWRHTCRYFFINKQKPNFICRETYPFFITEKL